MTLTISCPDCQRPLRVPENLLGQAVKCPSCSHTFVAPEGVEETPARPVAPPPRIDSNDEPRPAKLPAHDEDRALERDKAPSSRPVKPAKAQAIAIMILVGGIYALIWSLSSTLLSGFACCLWPGAYYGLVMGIMAILKGSNLLGDNAYRLPPPQGIVVMMIINIMNADLVNLTLGILVLVFLGDPEVRAYFRKG
jgi:predicted Zn finger-like uncharacterized protein